eukprot:CAMPEP_0178426052 /NCGR_PEP_ID=MMETSP0689_2-20121128/29038_1 /TAXON_ID=160604 /ORGANISM="Amphidinium massartii, Strain CS-259" /LENGTH=43 /DNA_ID= /DNA_START= /DNA_END= /DNA_ORIENTATION=
MTSEAFTCLRSACRRSKATLPRAWSCLKQARALEAMSRVGLLV